MVKVKVKVKAKVNVGAVIFTPRDTLAQRANCRVGVLPSEFKFRILWQYFTIANTYSVPS